MFKRELLCRWPELKSDRPLPAARIPVKEGVIPPVTTVPPKAKESFDIVFSRVAMFGFLRQGMIALLVFIVVIRLLIHLILM